MKLKILNVSIIRQQTFQNVDFKTLQFSLSEEETKVKTAVPFVPPRYIRSNLRFIQEEAEVRKNAPIFAIEEPLLLFSRIKAFFDHRGPSTYRRFFKIQWKFSKFWFFEVFTFRSPEDDLIDYYLVLWNG